MKNKSLKESKGRGRKYQMGVEECMWKTISNYRALQYSKLDTD